MPTVIFALLRNDHIIFASDSRHVRGDQNGRYKNDRAFKVENILGDRALLGFAGSDHTEEVVARLKRNGKLETGSLQEAAMAVETQIRSLTVTIFNKGVPRLWNSSLLDSKMRKAEKLRRVSRWAADYSTLCHGHTSLGATILTSSALRTTVHFTFCGNAQRIA